MKIDRVTLALAKKYTDEHGGGGGTSNYNSLSNKPKINSVELSGNKSLSDLGVPLDTDDLTNGAGFITANDIPADVSAFNNDAGYITKSVNDLTNYTTTANMNTALGLKQNVILASALSIGGTTQTTIEGALGALNTAKINTSDKGVAGGIAELDNTGKVPSSQLPSYVDDVVDGYYNTIDGKFYEESAYTTEIPGEAGKIYISVDTDLQYRWTGSAFAALGGALVLGETSSSAYRGDRGKTAYDDSQTNKTAIGTMANLETSEKGSLVCAINELYTGMRTGGFTPIGTVISYMGATAPQNYLACDDTTYNIADYPELAAFFEAQFGSANYFGGDGTTTFKCPDLRGEFLRGTGTNGHTNQGSGANVGVHQDGTEHLFNRADNAGIYVSNYTHLNNVDTNISANGRAKITGTADASGAGDSYTARPTNTSVLYCIAYKDIYVDARYDYRTTEKIVGTWIDGKPIYQKTFAFPSGVVLTANAWGATSIIASNLSLGHLVSGEAIDTMASSGKDISFPVYVSIDSNGKIALLQTRTGTTQSVNILTIRYRKSTD